MESEQANPVDTKRLSSKFPIGRDFDKHQKKTGGYIGRNVRK